MHPRDADTLSGGVQAQFPTTVWSSIFQSSDRNSTRFREKMEWLLTRYWRPVYRTIRIVWRKGNEESKDLTQSFLMMVVEDDLVARFCPQKGRFRSFLKAALKHFMADEEKARQRIKRGGGKPILSLHAEEEGAEIDPEDARLTPEEVLDREWADNLLEEGIAELEQRLTEEGKEKVFRVYELIDLNSTPEGRISYREAADQLGLTESDVTHYLHTARRRLRGILVSRIGEYALTEDELVEELSRVFGG